MSLNEAITPENFNEDSLLENSARTRILSQLLNKMQKLSGFIEVELEDHPAEEYMDEFAEALASAREIAESLIQPVVVETSSQKEIKLNDLFTEIATRRQKIGAGNLALTFEKDEDLFVSALPSELSTACFSLLENGKDLSVSIESVAIDADKGLFANANVPSGNYWGVIINEAGGVGQSSFVSASPIVIEASSNQEMLNYGTILSNGGEVLVQSEEEAIMLLLPQANGMPITNESGSDEHLRGSETILVVDDEDMIWDILIENLQDLDYTVLLAGNGAEAVEIYRENPGMIDAVILDMVMPVMNGREAFAALKEIDPKVNVILSSGYMAESDAEDVLQGGAKAFLHKPYRMTDLARTIRDLF